jgi:stage V sporulation protein S
MEEKRVPDGARFSFFQQMCLTISKNPLPKYHNSLTYISAAFRYIKRAVKSIHTIKPIRRHNMDMIKVSANSRTSAVAGAIAGVVREHKRAEVQAIGAGAVNQAVKALVLATGYLKLDGIEVACVPEFADVTIEDKVRTAIKLVIEPQ